MKGKIAAWLGQTKTYPNGSTFSRAQSLACFAFGITALVILVAAEYYLLKFLFGRLISS